MTKSGVARGVAVAAVFLIAALTGVAAAATPAPPFSQCPHIGSATSCNLLIVLNADGATSLLSDPAVAPFDNSEDTLVGVLNQTGVAIGSIQLSSNEPIFGFDGDGICSAGTSPRPAACPFGLTGYEGPGTSFSVTTTHQGTVNFSPALADGASAYFGLEQAVTAAQITLPTLTYVQQPTDVQVGQPITPAVSLVLKNSTTPVPGATVSVSLLPNAAGGTLGGTTSAVTDANGVATFSNLTIDKSGSGYQLRATSGSLTATSNTFNVAAILVPCTNGCSASTPDPTAANPTAVQITVPGTSSLRSTAASGSQLEVIFDPTSPTFCVGSSCIGALITILPPSVQGGPITVDFVYDKSISGQRGASLYNVWKDSGSGPKLLPTCKVPNPILPCVAQRKRVNAGNLFIEVVFTGPDPIFSGG
jgi:hypothetical protein